MADERMRAIEQAGRERTMVTLSDIVNTDLMDVEARKLGGALVGKDERSATAMWAFPTRGAAYDFMFIARQQGYKAQIHRPLFEPLDALREDTERIRWALKKPPLRPPWAR